MKFYFFVGVLYLVFGCSNQQTTLIPTNITSQIPQTSPQHVSQLPFLDTIIDIAYRQHLTDNKPINSREAERSLYEYFKAKGILSQKELLIRSTINNGSESVDYDTVYQIQSANLCGAVVSYWLGSLDLNGHCFQPSKAIILNTKKGYKITRENFIPTNFIIDSVKGTNIYGYDYECGGRGILRQFRIRLK